MIFGVGIDMVEISRVTKMWDKGIQSYRDKIFTPKEQQEITTRVRRAASDFAGKEAVLKMFGTGFCEGMEAHMVEILRRDSGQPYVVLHERAEEFAKINQIEKIHLSITDTATLVTAIAVGELKD